MKKTLKKLSTLFFRHGNKILFLLISLLTCSFASAQTDIEFRFDSLKNSDIVIGHYYNKKLVVDDTVSLEASGAGHLIKSDPLPQGVYIIYVSENNYFDFLLGADQKFSLHSNPKNWIQNLRISGAVESEAFAAYQQFMFDMQRNSAELKQKLTQLDAVNRDSLNAELNAIDEKVSAKYDELINRFPGTFLAKFIKALKPIEYPEFNVPATVANKDSALWWKRYEYTKEHYFEYFDISDDRMLRTPFFNDKVENYLTKVIIQVPDTIAREAVRIIEIASGNEESYQYLCQFLINWAYKSNLMGMDRVFYEIAVNYYLDGSAQWADSATIKNIAERVVNIRNNLLGNKAKNLELMSHTGEPVSLYQVDAPYTVIVFWEPDCGHCKKIIPDLKEKVYDKYKDKGLEVYAVLTQHDMDAWEKFIADHELDWINVYDPYLQSNFRMNYDIYSTPIIYLLDKDKKILAKRVSVRTLEDILEKEM